jgi:hypothetical protein
MNKKPVRWLNPPNVSHGPLPDTLPDLRTPICRCGNCGQTVIDDICTDCWQLGVKKEKPWQKTN